MKKIITLTLAFSTLAFAGFSQGKSNGKGKAKKHKTEQRSDRDDRWDDDDRDDRDHARNGQKYSKNTPAKVRAAFNRDYPNATNVSWTKDRGYWTAHFGSGIFGGSNSVTYKANGTRVGTNSSTGVFGTNRDRRVDTRTDAPAPTRRKKTPYEVMTRGPF